MYGFLFSKLDSFENQQRLSPENILFQGLHQAPTLSSWMLHRD